MPDFRRPARRVALGAAVALLVSCSGSDPAPTPEPEPEPGAPTTYSPTAGGGVCVSPGFAARIAAVPIAGTAQSGSFAVRITPLAR